jgi:hypothetical protein
MMPYGGYFIGWYDLQTANRQAIAGTAGVASGVVAMTSAFLIVGTYGAASTGTAISTLLTAALPLNSHHNFNLAA